MSKKIKILVSILFIVIIMFVVCQPILAQFDAGQVLGDGKNFIEKGQSGNKIDVNSIANIMKPVAGVLLGIGTVVIIAVGLIIGMKYMTASPDAKGKLKTQLIGLVVATIVLYGAYGIWSIAYSFMTEITK